MVWTTMKQELKRVHKDTRWDRIRKKHSSTVNINSNAVKKLVDMDFVGKNNIRFLNGEVDLKRNLNPNLVMDLRHEMTSKHRSSTSKGKYQTSARKCIVHNLEIEDRYISNELSKFRSQMSNDRQSCTIKPISQNNDKLNKPVIKNLQMSSQKTSTSLHIEDFYVCPVHSGGGASNSKTITESNSTPNLERSPAKTEKGAEEDDHESHSTEQNADKEERISNASKPCIRFDDDAETVKFSRENSSCSCTSYSTDSVISELADRAMVQIEADNDSASMDDMMVTGSGLNKNEVETIIVTKIQPGRIIDVDDSTTSSNSNTCDEYCESNATNEQNAMIDQLFETEHNANKTTLKKYFLNWIHFTTIQKIERENITNKTDRINKINAFLDHIRKKKKQRTIPKKKDPSVRQIAQNKMQNLTNMKKYQSKIKLQQDIIELQKMKLDRQERIITELKLSKMSEEAKEARQNIKTELKNVLRTGDYKVRAKAKCLQIMGNLRDEEDDELARLQGKSLMQPKFLLNMQERALMRTVKHEQAKQRRMQKEAEREAAKLAFEEAKRLEDEQAKKMRIEMLKEKRRQEKIAKIVKEREHRRAIDNKKKAQTFYRKHLLRRIGMEGFKRILKHKRLKEKKSEALRMRLYKRNAFMAWKTLYFFRRRQKMEKANNLYAKQTKRRVMRIWRDHLELARSKYNVAVDWYDLKLHQYVFTRWSDYVKLQKIVEDMKIKQAECHHDWHLKWKVLDRWQRLPHVLKLEKDTEERRQRWRMKIWELLPDYTPNRDNESV